MNRRWRLGPLSAW